MRDHRNRKAQSELNTALPVALMTLILLGGFFLLGSASPPPPTEKAGSAKETAMRLLDSAVASARERKLEVATIQALAAARQLDALEESSEAPRALAADWLVRQGRYREAVAEYELLVQIRPTYLPDLKSARNTYDKQQRVAAVALLEQARSSKANDSVRFASEALGLFQKHGGNRQQLRETHQVLGQAYLKAGNRRLAQHHLGNAGDSSLLARVEQPRVDRPTAPVAPSYPTKDPHSVRVHGSSPVASPPVAVVPVKPRTPKGGVVIGQRPKPTSRLDLGRADNLKSYHNSGGKKFVGY